MSRFFRCSGANRGRGHGDKERLQQRVSKDCVAKVLFQGKATQQAVEKLVAYLNLVKDTVPSES